MSHPKPCTQEHFCPAMERALSTQNFNGKGLSEPPIFDCAKGQEIRIGIVYKNAPRDRGVMLNLCPWCGADLRWNRTENAGA